MNPRLLSILSTVMLLAGVALAKGATPADASHSWGPPYHWARTANPFSITVVDSVTDPWNSHLDAARGDWAAMNVIGNLPEIAGSESSKDRRRCTAIAGKIRVCNMEYGQNGWLGLAQIWISSSHITQGVAKMNDSYHKNPPYNTSAWRQFVMCQEVGHLFGLGHQDESFANANLGTCMDYTRDPDGTLANPDQLSNQSPDAHDNSQLSLIYGSGHPNGGVDSSSTIAAGAASRPDAADEGGNGPADWGRPIRSDRHGNPNLYRKELGGGRLVFTWVLTAGASRGGQH